MEEWDRGRGREWEREKERERECTMLVAVLIITKNFTLGWTGSSATLTVAKKLPCSIGVKVKLT